MTELSVSGLKALAYEQFEQGHFAEAAELLEVLESRIGSRPRCPTIWRSPITGKGSTSGPWPDSGRLRSCRCRPRPC